MLLLNSTYNFIFYSTFVFDKVKNTSSTTKLGNMFTVTLSVHLPIDHITNNVK